MDARVDHSCAQLGPGCRRLDLHNHAPPASLTRVRYVLERALNSMPSEPPAMIDQVFRGGQIADGVAGELRRADVGVSGGRIVAVGDLARTPGAHTIDTGGLVLAPGFIDLHTHYDAQLTWEATATPSPSLGVTSIVIGNCGFGLAPCRPEHRSLLARNLSVVEGMPLAALEAGVRWEFETFPEFLAMLRRRGVTPNVAVFAGHSTIRTHVMGAAASERAAREDEIAAMCRVLADALAAGAIGFASSFSHNHFGHGGVPMPSRFARREETDTLIRTLAAAPQGVFQVASGPDIGVADLSAWARTTGRTVVWSALFQMDAFPDRAPAMLAEARRAQAAGLKVYAQVTSQPLSMEFTLANAYPLGSLDVWEPLLSATPAAIARRLLEPAFREAFRGQLARPKKGKIFYGDWDRIEIAQVARDANRALEGETVGRVAAARGVDPVDLFFDLAVAEDLETVFV
ncbi:MAG: hypothetical protein EXQ96_11170, partial [Alphaproteobacteria bacterium]|nr:hypothetical protein [Alphaproteobacteria bacterium]